MSDIREFQITWKRDLFVKHKSMLVTAKYLIRRSVVIVQAKLCRQVNHLKNELQSVQQEREILKNSLAEHLQQRLQTLQNDIRHYNCQIKTRTKHEKEYWKQLANIIERRTNVHRSLETATNTQSIVGVNHKTFVTTHDVDRNDENRPPVKLPKVRKNKKCRS